MSFATPRAGSIEYREPDEATGVCVHCNRAIRVQFTMPESRWMHEDFRCKCQPVGWGLRRRRAAVAA